MLMKSLPAIYACATPVQKEPGRMLKAEKIQVTIILLKGRRLAERTSNAFGVVEDFSLLSTTRFPTAWRPRSSDATAATDCNAKANCFNCLVFCTWEKTAWLARLGII